MTGADFRRAGPDDADALLALMRDFYVCEHLPYDAERLRRLLAELFARPALGQVWVMVAEGEAVGYFVLGFGFSLEFGGRDAFLDELFVAEAWRGRGLGTEALARAEAACRAAGIAALHLEVDHTNHGARALYERRGFRAHPRALMTRWIAGEDGAG